VPGQADARFRDADRDPHGDEVSPGGSYVALAAGETEPVSDAVPHLLGRLRRG
jgi:hypothetical protein